MTYGKFGLWLALGAGVGAAFGSAGVLGMGEAVAWGVAAGVIAGTLFTKRGKPCA